MAKQIPVNIKNILNETRMCFDSIYAQRVKELILFGSYARGDFESGSDIDLLLLLDHLDDVDTERARFNVTLSVFTTATGNLRNAIQHQHVGQRQARTSHAIQFAAATLENFVSGEGCFCVHE
jgi:predicted nucleotidyltransferase